MGAAPPSPRPAPPLIPVRCCDSGARAEPAHAPSSVGVDRSDPWVAARRDRRAILARWRAVDSITRAEVLAGVDGEELAAPRWTLTGGYLQPRPRMRVPTAAEGPDPDPSGPIPMEPMDLEDRRTWVHLESASAHREEWPWDLDAERRRIASCESAVCVAWTGGSGPDAWRPVVLRCGSRLCPVCWRARAGRAVSRWGPVIEAAIADGAAAWHLTLTQRPMVAEGSAILPSEARRWSGSLVGSERTLPAVAGESAFSAYRRWLGTWRDLAQSRTLRGLECGILRGCEWTLRSSGPRAPRVQAPRWHAHGHVLIVVRDRGWTPAHLLETWAALSGADAGDTHHGVTRIRRGRSGREYGGAQYVRRGGQYGERIADRSAVVEVLKYPFKPSELTIAGALDAWGALRGARTHFPGRAFHASSTLASVDPWRSWLSAGRSEAGWSLLEWAWPESVGTAAELAADDAAGEVRRVANGWHAVTARSAFPCDRAVLLRVATVDATGARVWREWYDDHPDRYASVAQAHPVGAVGPLDPDDDGAASADASDP